VAAKKSWNFEGDPDDSVASSSAGTSIAGSVSSALGRCNIGARKVATTLRYLGLLTGPDGGPLLLGCQLTAHPLLVGWLVPYATMFERDTATSPRPGRRVGRAPSASPMRRRPTIAAVSLSTTSSNGRTNYVGPLVARSPRRDRSTSAYRGSGHTDVPNPEALLRSVLRHAMTSHGAFCHEDILTDDGDRKRPHTPGRRRTE
jgi:hypothetical protein